MIRYVDLGTNIEKEIQPADVETFSIANTWFELVDPTEAELQAVAEATDISVNLLRFPKTLDTVDLRLEPGYGIINFLVMQDVISTKKVHPLVIVFAKNFLVTVSKKEIQPIINIAKERMSKSKNDPPSQVTYYIIDEVIANHYVHIQKLETMTSKIEEEVVEKTSPDTLKHIFKLKSNMIRFNKVLWYERGLVFNLHKCGDNCMVAKARGMFDTTHEDLTRQIDIVETYREILSDAINVHLSVGFKQNQPLHSRVNRRHFLLNNHYHGYVFPQHRRHVLWHCQFGNTDVAIVSRRYFAVHCFAVCVVVEKEMAQIPKATVGR